MNNHEQLWQHFIHSGNPMSYIAYRHANKNEPHSQKALTGHPFSLTKNKAAVEM